MNYEELKALFEQSLEKNLKVQSLLKKIVSGTANFSDTAEYSNAVSSILSYIVKRNVSDIEDAEEITEKLLHDYYEHINSILAQVQSSLDKNNGLHIKPQEAVFPKERVKKFSHSLIDPTVPFETIQRRAGSGIETICRSFHDDYIKENAEIRHNAGLKCYIVRTSSGKCCDWCSRIAGRYVYGREPKDVYRRHDNCDCKCIFENGRERQDVWSKKKWEVRETPKTDFIPKSLTPRQAEQIQAENMKYKGLDISQESDIIGVGSDDVILENQRYGRNKTTLVNKTYIESGEYRRKYDNATDNQEVNKTLYDCAKQALKHRSGTVFEDMYWIDSETGKIVLSVTDSTDERAIIYTDKIKNTIKNNKNIITLHTHPSSMPPSISDLNSCCKNKYKIGFIACHDGRVFAYSSNMVVNEQIYNMYIQRYTKDGYDEFSAQLKALERLSKSFDIKVWEVNYNG